ncbi:MAG TPA: response regulator transcription factor [Actinophytocola sp.]|uniref:response regulator transcription factor n=1 Tax=Actinophytocola sp. TaxID=1872138 RepID=UPI002DFDE4E8|nr:response regulator transcription factor [Actinophytocola sp.]
MRKVLVVEKDPTSRAALTDAMTALGYEVKQAATALDALRGVITEPELNLALFDLHVSDLDGLTALRMLRDASDVPVIATGNRSSEKALVKALNGGADDYLIKPFSTEHLIARINALLRRTTGRPAPSEELLVVGELRIDPVRRGAWMGDRPLTLTRREFDLLTYLAQRIGQVISKSELSRSVWSRPHPGTGRTIDVHASWLRRKLGETAAKPRYLHTVRGVGFRMVVPEMP